jgi:hypothetical protein
MLKMVDQVVVAGVHIVRTWVTAAQVYQVKVIEAGMHLRMALVAVAVLAALAAIRQTILTILQLAALVALG